MKKGDKVRFLSEVGGGKVAGFQGKNIVLVEDEDGFEIPMPINEVVVVEQDEYSMGKMISAKMDAQQKAEEHANTELHQDSRSIKAILNDHDDVDMDVEEYDAADREITFVKPVEERTGGNKLSAYLAFVPINIKDVTNTRFETYMVNDSNYYLRYTYLVAEGNAWTLKAEGEIEPNTKLFIEEFGREALNEISAKMDAQQKAEEHANTELHQDSRSIKAILNDHDDVDMDVEEYDAADREITFVKPVEERTGGNKLSAYLAFVPINIKDVTNTRFETYMVNDSNYYLRYTYLVAEGNAWTLKAEGEIEPNTKLFIEEFGREALNEMEHIAIQMIAYKKLERSGWRKGCRLPDRKSVV